MVKEKSIKSYTAASFEVARVIKRLVPKVRVELTQGHPYRFLSLVRVVLISVIRRDLVLLTN